MPIANATPIGRAIGSAAEISSPTSASLSCCRRNFTLVAVRRLHRRDAPQSADEGDRSRQIFCRWECIVGHARSGHRELRGRGMLPWRTFDDPGRLRLHRRRRRPACRPSTSISMRLSTFIAAPMRHGVSIVGLCTGSFVMAEAGLMRGRRCAVHIHHRQQLLERYPDIIPVVNEMYVHDEKLITCPGGTAAIDLAVEILSEHCGRNRGMKGMTALVVDEHRGAHHVGRMPFQDLEECGDWRVENAVRLMRQNLREPCTIEQLSANRRLDHAPARPQLQTPCREIAASGVARNAPAACALAPDEQQSVDYPNRARMRLSPTAVTSRAGSSAPSTKRRRLTAGRGMPKSGAANG